MAYLGKTPSQAVRSRYYYTATGGETSLSGADDNSNVLTFTDGNYVDVSLNGVALVAGTDYNTTTTNTIGGLTALVASDVVEVIVYDTFSVFSGNVTGDFTVGGTLTAANITNTGNLNFGDNDKAIFGAGSDLQIYHTGANSWVQDAGTGNLILAADNLTINSSDGTEYKAQFATNGAVTLYHDNAAKLATTSTGVDVTGGMNTTGNVGIGTSSPSETLHVEESTTGNAVRVSRGGNYIVMGGSGSGTQYVKGYEGTVAFGNAFAGNTTFLTGDTERMRITSAGEVLVGTTDTSVYNNVTGTGVVIEPNSIQVARSGGPTLLLNRQSSDGEIQRFLKDGTTVGSIGSRSAGNIYIDSAGESGRLQAAGSDVLGWYTGQFFPASDAGATLGTSGNRFSNLYLSGGVYLGGTGSANYLDDYEEGTFTATYGASGSDTGYYTKIGRFVTVHVTLRDISQTFSIISGIPFTNAGDSIAGCIGRIIGFSGFDRSNLGVNSTSTTIQLFDENASAATVTSGTGTVRLDITLSYYTS